MMSPRSNTMWCVYPRVWGEWEGVHFVFVFLNVLSSTYPLILSEIYLLGGLQGPLDMLDPSHLYI